MSDQILTAQQIDNKTIKAGRLIRVKNTKKPKFSNAKDQYVSVWIEDSTGKNERCLLFTEREILIAENRAKKNKEDCPDKGFLQNLID